MIQSIKKVFKSTFLYDFKMSIQEKQTLYKWERNNKPIPPPHFIKQRTVKQYAKKYSINILVETGTYLGDMVDATKNTFNRIVSIELDKNLYEKATKKFNGFDHISIIHGDSAEILQKILVDITQPCLFWLDGHYSAGVTARGSLDTPIRQELQHILHHNIQGHVILIDDARCFVGQNDYPAIEELREQVLKINPDLEFEVKDDIIRIFNANKSPNK